ncbi:unnamed protein product [Didymodactylos carnosus]|uniref:MARVEL domain-containing protein n=1 Tax=Didymodactylos carnosus TaxID=1234261 RepID=A0A813XW71_9BILA|nr:unnamed protein product [Didymodactylos carnosus]CAF0876502.1 unnamed protein product [Didymodactylos carnosus]CAF3524913.1 unnamed protein product [Didymodactylos carnosus]CAF3663315.1 unnamed protein product [Didymodactylos carnosus]
MQSTFSAAKTMAYWGVFKEPRGLIRLLEFIFAIFAFATAVNGASRLIINAPTPSEQLSAAWSYPYSLSDVVITGTNTSERLSDSNGIKPSAEFFVFTGVTSFLLSLAACIMYVFFDVKYRQDERLPLLDLLITVLWTIFWIAGSSETKWFKSRTAQQQQQFPSSEQPPYAQQGVDAMQAPKRPGIIDNRT